MRVVDSLAHEYGWTKDYILNRVYPGEAVKLTGIIRQRTYSEKMLELAIVSNPWAKEPKKLWDLLERQAGAESELGSEEIDRAKLQALKQQLKTKSRVIKVK
jgi:hypothetical protein